RARADRARAVDLDRRDDVPAGGHDRLGGHAAPREDERRARRPLPHPDRGGDLGRHQLRARLVAHDPLRVDQRARGDGRGHARDGRAPRGHALPGPAPGRRLPHPRGPDRPRRLGRGPAPPPLPQLALVHARAERRRVGGRARLLRGALQDHRALHGVALLPVARVGRPLPASRDGHARRVRRAGGEVLMTVLEALEQSIPFAFLDAGRRAWIASRSVLRRADPKAPVLRDEDHSAGNVFLVASGSVDVGHGHGRQTIPAGQFFGELVPLLDGAHDDARAGELGADLVVIAGQDFLALVDESNVFAQSLATILVRKLKVFDGYRAFYSKLLELTGRGSFFLSELLPLYRALRPALHPKLDSSELDVDALRYAVLRLPDEVTRTTFYFLTDTLPVLYSDPD